MKSISPQLDWISLYIFSTCLSSVASHSKSIGLLSFDVVFSIEDFILSFKYVKASSAPAAINFSDIAQAILLWFATPQTTPLFPDKS